MQPQQPFFSQLFQTLRQAPRRSKILSTFFALMTLLSLWNCLETIRLILSDRNNPFLGYLWFGLFLQVTVWSLFLNKFIKLISTRTAPPIKHDPEPTK